MVKEMIMSGSLRETLLCFAFETSYNTPGKILYLLCFSRLNLSGFSSAW